MEFYGFLHPLNFNLLRGNSPPPADPQETVKTVDQSRTTKRAFSPGPQSCFFWFLSPLPPLSLPLGPSSCRKNSRSGRDAKFHECIFVVFWAFFSDLLSVLFFPPFRFSFFPQLEGGDTGKAINFGFVRGSVHGCFFFFFFFLGLFS